MTDTGIDSDTDASASAEATRQVIESGFYDRARADAVALLDDPRRLARVASAAAMSTALRSGPFAEVLDEFRTLVRLVMATARGHWTPRSVDDVTDIVATLIYVDSPIDVIPDRMPLVGYLDDVALTGWVLRKAIGELDAFRAWELGLDRG